MRRRARIRWIAAALLCLTTDTAQAQCRLALAMALDVSGSVDAREYRQQLDGVAGALMDPAVQSALFSMPHAPVALYIYEWSAPQFQRRLIPWTLITSPEILRHVTTALRRTPRIDSPKETGLGMALIHGGAALDAGPPCTVQTLDVSGDGENNSGPRPQDRIARAAVEGITVNGLVIDEDPASNLPAYFRAYVQHGPFSFVERANGFDDYQAAMTRKLLRELQSMVIGALHGTAPAAAHRKRDAP